MNLAKKAKCLTVIVVVSSFSVSGLAPAIAEDLMNIAILSPTTVTPTTVTPTTVTPTTVTPTTVTPTTVTPGGSSIIGKSSGIGAQPEGVREVLNWVCKTIITIVGVAVWLPTVVTTGGTTAIVMTMVIKYLSVPVLVCAWL